MRKFVIVGFMLLLMLCGCTKEEPIPTAGVFDFVLPEGYHIGDVTEKSCLIYSEEIAVGGCNLTEISSRKFKDRDSTAIPAYLNETADGCEFFSWVGSNPDNPVRYVTQQFTDAQTGERRIFTRVLFIKENGVYDMWFDTALIHEESVSLFYPIAEGK